MKQETKARPCDYLRSPLLPGPLLPLLQHQGSHQSPAEHFIPIILFHPRRGSCYSRQLRLVRGTPQLEAGVIPGGLTPERREKKGHWVDAGWGQTKDSRLRRARGWGPQYPCPHLPAAQGGSDRPEAFTSLGFQ